MNTLTKISTALAMAFISCQTLYAAGANIRELEERFEATLHKALETQNVYGKAMKPFLNEKARQFLLKNSDILQQNAIVNLKDLDDPNTNVVHIFLLLRDQLDHNEHLPEDVEQLRDQMEEMIRGAESKIDPAIIDAMKQAEQEQIEASKRLTEEEYYKAQQDYDKALFIILDTPENKQFLQGNKEKLEQYIKGISINNPDGELYYKVYKSLENQDNLPANIAQLLKQMEPSIELAELEIPEGIVNEQHRTMSRMIELSKSLKTN